MKKKIFTIFSIVVILIVMSSIELNVLALTQSEVSQQISEAENAKKSLNEQAEQAESEKAEITSDKEDAESELESLTIKVTTAENELAKLKSQLSELNDSIEEKEKEIAAQEKEIEEKDLLLKQRMVALYEAGDTTYLDVLFNSEDILDFLSNYSMIQQIMETDTELINSLKDEKEKLESDKASLEEDKQKVENLKSEQEIKSNELKALQSQKQSEVDKLSADEQAKQDEIDSYNAAMVKVNETLQSAYKKFEELQKKAAASASSSSGSSSGSAGLKFDGSFIWPCSCKYVTSTVKRRWGRQHKGIDIGASYEAVYASASGYCYNAYDKNGYGTYIMIFHGDGYVTLYGHLSSSHVSDGQYVKQGATIATSGNSGGSTGAHLHFEIRQASNISQFFSNSPLNPLDYLPGGYTLAPGATTES